MRNYSGILFVLACIVLAIGVIKPDTPASWIITTTIVAPTFWFVFIGFNFIHRWQSHHYIFVGWFISLANLVLLFFVVNLFAPYLISALSEWMIF